MGCPEGRHLDGLFQFCRGLLRAASAGAQDSGDPFGRFDEAGFAGRVGDAQVTIRGVVAKVDPGCRGDARVLDQAPCEDLAVVGEMTSTTPADNIDSGSRSR